MLEEDVKEDGMNEIKVKCSVKEGMWTSSDAMRRPIFQFSMLPHSPYQQYRNRMAKLRSRTRRRPIPRLFHSWMGNRTQRVLVQDLLRDEGKIVKCCGSDSYASEFILSDFEKSSSRRKLDFDESFSKIDQVVEEPWILQSTPVCHCVADLDIPSDVNNEGDALKHFSDDTQEPKILNQSRLRDDFDHKFNYDLNEINSSERYEPLLANHPVEEPWIFESSTCAVHSMCKTVSSVFNNESDKEDTQSPLSEQQQQVPENLLHGEESNMTTKEDPVSTVILINSSICTVQRIAVLENDKLVELLLEPVKTNVQCDSVYLGVVTKLVPHMGGAFVNIGSPRPSFMDIRPNREPFILPSFHGREREGNGSIIDKPGEQMDFPESGTFSSRVEEADEVEDDQNEDEFINDEFESHENSLHFDVLEVIKENVNGSLVRHECEDETQGLLQQLNGDMNQLQTKSDQEAGTEVIGTEESKWAQVKKGCKIIVQVVKEGLGTKGPTLTAYPKLRSRFWILLTRCNTIGISKKISGVERTRLRVIAKTLQPPGFGLTVRTVASGHSLGDLQKDLEGLLSTWKGIVDHAKSAALAADEGVDGAVPVLLHRAMGQTLSVVQDYFNEKVKSMVVDSPRTYHEVTNYLQEIAPDLCDRIELYSKRTPLFDEYNIEEEINNILSKRVPLANGGYLVIEQTEALVSIDVNGGHCVLGQGTSQEKAILEVNLAAAKQIARELRLRDIGGIIVVDFIDMLDDSNKRLVYEEVKKAVERDRSTVKVSELSRHGLMEITRKRVRPSVTFMISEPCTCCHATGRVESLETSFSRIEHEICRLLSTMDQKADPENPKSWPRFILRVDRHMCNYLTSGKRTRLAVLSSSLKVWILLKVARGLTRGTFELKPLTDENTHKNQYQGAAISVLRPKEVVTYSPNGKVTLFPIKKWKTGGK
ncbi:ribonuclease E/G-like protein, chloroplastic isoform X2 [Sesamum indicum]|uniref:Ribonuclease E/G-like protein, chloroplastic isoform X2 n=1 Tax=Sesamum indicum TaxID=4182 RepID=A0A6I9TWZ8_SESIN|nr:ribonuclease E/G-like protein, chloroplastic isoform X2 [Sesamum indicum]